MSKDQIALEIKNIVLSKKTVTQDELAQRLAAIRFLTIRESYPVIKDMIANDQLRMTTEATGKMVFHA
jgi:hypothetical protein